MKIVFKFLFLFILIIIALFLLTLLAGYLNHQIQLSKENKHFTPPGQMVEVNNHRMHVYSEGDGEKTLVFMAGGGTSSPFLDFKSLYSLLDDEYKIVVVKKAGYGFSDITDSERDIETILNETREALHKARVEEPYILVPHSMSGIEALYWAQTYPDEIEAIIGLDMAVPAAYEELDIETQMPFIRLGEFVAKTGFIRWLPILSESDAVKHGTLTKEEKELYEVVFYRRTSTKNMINEIKQINENAKIVEKGKIPEIPMLLFSSNGEDTGWSKRAWLKLQRDFVYKQENSSLIELDGSHSIHNIKFERIAEIAKVFIEGL